MAAPPPFLEIWIGFSLLITFWEFYLDWRQLSKNKEKDPPHEIKDLVPLDRYTKSQLYQVDKRYFTIFNRTVGFFVSTLSVVYAMPYLWDVAKDLVGENEYYRSVAWYIMISFVTYPIDIPLELYGDFVIEARHGFNKKTLKLFVMDTVKNACIQVVFIAILVPLVIGVVRWGGEHFYLYIWGVCQVLIFVFMFLYPTLIMPLFNKYEPLHDASLKKKIEDLAAGLNYPLQKLFQMDGSKRSAHSNAYMFGFWKNKRIVLFDTLLQITVGLTKDKAEEALGFEFTADGSAVKVSGLKKDVATVAGKWNDVHSGRNDELKEGTAILKLAPDSLESLTKKTKEELANLSDTEKVMEGLKALQEQASGTLTVIIDRKPYTDNEILAILCHEIGHWFHGHVLRSLIVTSVHTFVLFRLYAFVMYSSDLFQSFGYAADERSVMVGLSLFSFMFTPVETFVGFGMTFMTRMNEYQADDFAVKMKRADDLGTGLRTLCVENLGDLNPDPLYAWFHHSHPSLVERLQNMKAKDAAINKKTDKKSD